MLRVISLGSAVLVLLLMAATQSSPVQGYPEPAGSIAVAASETTTTTGESVTITATLRDVDGRRLSGTLCSLGITKQPGVDATISPTRATTDSSGVVTATVNVGSRAGLIEVRVTCAGVAGTVTVVAGEAVAPPADPVELGPPPAATVDLPEAGTGVSETFVEFEFIISLGAAAALLMLGGIALRIRRGRA